MEAETWQDRAIRELSWLAPASMWERDEWGDPCLAEDPDEDWPGWLVTHEGRELTMSCGSYEQSADTNDNLTETARRMQAAHAAFEAGRPEEVTDDE